MKKIVDKIVNGKFWLPLVVLVLIGINWLAASFHTRIDFTNEKRFTLSKSTKSLLTGLDSTVDITVLLSGDIKSEFKKLSNSTKELLDNFKNYGGNHIQYRFEIPGEGLNDSLKAYVFDSLVAMGLRPTNQQVQVKEGEGKSQRQIFPAAIIRYGDKSVPIDLLQGQVQKNVFNSDDVLDKESLNSAEALLEFKFANAIQKLTQKETPIVAYAYGNGEPPYGFLPVNDVFNTLGSNFIVDTVNVKIQPFIPQEYNTVVIVKPTEKFTEDDKFKLDQYVMNGGRLLFLVDVLYAERDSLQSGELTAYARDLNLNDLLFRFGVRINPDLIADKHCDVIPVEVGSVGGQSQKQLLPWPYSPLLLPGSDHPIVKNQADVLANFANSIDLVEAEGINKTVLLSSSSNSTTFATPAIVQLNSLQTVEDVKSYNKKNIPVAVLLEGKFTSMFANRVTQSQLDTLKSYNIPFLRESIAPGKVIVVSDADIVMNQVSETIGPLPMGTNKYTKVGYANKDFFLNCTEYLANKKNILDARAKDYTLRLLDVKKTEEERTLWQVICIVLPVLLVALFGFVYQWWRKRKYTR
ncbi:gliding motility-associated ABC transporter substrate-binding protein GldG [Ferruginibacter lapsinanis]|uniref:gliding motility-associated ABC transporter substrate-binding protein GldG n=1 Tax=Ferruginibacter lapsinanis TaxID=563172 RepID=UPI001E5441DB|nr:gliding motility-associated ABC transporter substrate-binding protein GldG [Ferruginibacter lapsinanis]UEG51194.1 gliding motility-associated ABC transporter substrate-binding protein GldG [Ferruginibacter lapsinanis]